MPRGGFGGGHGGFHGGGGGIHVVIGGGFIGGGGYPEPIVMFPHRECPPHMAVIVENGGYPPREEVIVEPRRHAEVIVERPPVPIVEQPYNERVTPGLRSVGANDAQAIADAAGALNAENAKTHLTFHMTSDGRAEADTQGLHGFFQKNDLAKVNREAIERGDPTFVQDMLGGPNSALRFDGKHIVVNPGVNQDDINAFSRNAEAIGAAVRGNYEEAREMYDSIHRGDVLKNPGPGQQPAPDTSTTPVKIDPKDRYREVSADENGKYHLSNPDGSQGAAVDLKDGKKYATMTSDGYYSLKPDGSLGDKIPDANIDHGDKAPATAAPDKNAPNKTPPVTPAQPEKTEQVSAEPSKYEKIELMQLELKMLQEKGFIKSDINKRGFGVDGNIGADTKRAESEVIGHSAAALSDDDFKKVTAAFQKDMKIDGNGDLNVETLKVLLAEKNKLAGAGVRVVDDVNLDRLVVTKDNPAAKGSDPLGAVKGSADQYTDEVKKRSAGKPIADGGDTQPQAGVRNLVFTDEDAKAMRLVTVSDVQHVDSGSSVSSKQGTTAQPLGGQVHQI